MAETKHSPGPWELRKISDRVWYITSADGFNVNRFANVNGLPAITKKDAELMTAAPELLAAVIKLMEDMQAVRGDNPQYSDELTDGEKMAFEVLKKF